MVSMCCMRIFLVVTQSAFGMRIRLHIHSASYVRGFFLFVILYRSDHVLKFSLSYGA